MRAVRVHELGGPEVLRYEEVETPEPGPGEALVKVAAAGVNYLDIYYRSGFHWGGHHGRALPYIPGAEGAGAVVAVGPEVSEVRVGDRVAYGISNGHGSYAELASVPERHLVRVPETVGLQSAAAAMLQGMTAHYLIHDTYPVDAGNTVLVHAAAGGTGLLLVQMAKMRGARVFGTVSTLEKARIAEEAGADAVIDYTREDFAAEARRLTDGRGVHVVYDSVGKSTFEKSLDALAPRGCMVIYGQSSGAVPPFDTAVLNAKGSLSLSRPSLTHHTTDRAEILARGGDVLRWIESGKLSVRIGRTLSLTQAAEAHRLLASRKTTGKILLTP
ncbi:MAG: quinone oxidoreductase [Deltaproteobacteria bacterium]|nr:quinone oxidoreductase [Deltaproteobacteria bacterium]